MVVAEVDAGLSVAIVQALVGVIGAVVVCDAEGTVVLCSERAQALLGSLGSDAAAVDAELARRTAAAPHTGPGPLASALSGSGSLPVAMTLTTNGGGAEVLVSAVTLTTAKGETVGAMLTLESGEAAVRDEAPLYGLHDVLTGLPNRRLLADRIEQAIARSRRAGNRFGVLMIDLDGFKKINDEDGHGYGDQLLRGVGARLTRTVRPNDTVARLGGDEFVVVCEGVDSEAAVEVLARRLLQALSAPLRIRDRDVVVGASIGITLADANRDGEELLRRADLAMYEAKRGGRNRWAHYDAELDRSARRSARLASELRLGIDAGDIEVAYQPEVDLQRRSVVGYEALVRWYHPELGMVPAAELVHAAERTDMILKLGAIVLDRACEQAATWSYQERPPSISVNLSARELTGPDFAERVLDTLARHGLPGSQLCLEITEANLMAVGAQDSLALRRLRDADIRLAIDDFGTGFASLTYLQRLPVQQVKIDRSVIRGLPDNRQDDAIVTSVLNLAHSLDLTVVATGVETLDQSAFLRTIGCDLGQGKYFGRPKPADELGESDPDAAADAARD